MSGDAADDAPKQGVRRNGLTYADAGVSIDAGDALVARIKPAAARSARPGVLGALGGFGALFDLRAAGYEDPLLVAATDGVGTKLKVAIETGLFGGVGIDLVAMCVNDLICQGAEPLFFLDYYATSHLDPAAAGAVVDGIAAGCAACGAALIGGETAEMPGLYAPGDFDLAGFAVGAVGRERLLPRPDIAEGDVVLGLESDGAHSNGYSLIRRIVADEGLDWAAPAPFAPDLTLGAALLTPTRLYVRPILRLLRDPALGPETLGLAHITGGGLVENPGRALPAHLAAEIDCAVWRRPPLFDWLADAGGVDDLEMARAFNIGLGLVVVVRAAAADAAAALLADAGERVHVIGRIILREDGAPPVRLSGLGSAP